MNPSELRSLRDVYHDGLLHDTLPFWFPRSVDAEFGGYFTCLDRDGSLLQTDKSVWFQGRMAWLLSTLHAELEPRPEWLAMARSGIDFLLRHGFDSDGRMFFSLTREGRPLRKRRYVFSECFAIMALAAYSRATGDPQWAEQAAALLDRVLALLHTPGALTPKTDPVTRPMKGLAIPMILLVVCQELRKARPLPMLDSLIDGCIAEVRDDFLKPEFECLLETVGPHGEFSDTLEGRMVNPGHSIEVAWFILEEARVRGRDADLVDLGCRILDWSWRAGWDAEHGGILYTVDCKGLPATEYWHDMKFWWPHNETLIATLLAWELTGRTEYWEKHQLAHAWSFAHFPDREHGEWFGYLHRDGSLSTRVKGTLFKGAFHLPRMQLVCSQILCRGMREGMPSG